MYNPVTHLPPGFRFHPTDEELIVHYLMNRKAAPPPSIIAEVDIYKFDPWDLPQKALFGDKEWYFFSPRERKYPNGVRPNRAAVSGYWKATGTDKAIRSGENNVGVKKALVFYRGKPPKGFKTNWIMHEYRLAELQNSNKYKPMCSRVIDQSTRQLDDWALCRIYKKSKHIPPPLIDPELLEDSSTEDPCSFPTQILPHNQQLPKTLSISEYLQNFPLDLPANPLFGHPITNHDNNAANAFFLPQLSQIESSDCFNLKIQQENERIVKEETSGSLLSFGGQFDSSQYSLLDQPFFSHQLLLNSRLGFQ